jgi:hypothetical protein
MDRTFAYFVVVGPGIPETITSHLDIEPSETWNKGDPRVPGGSPLGFMKWVLNSGLSEDEPWNEHIDALAELLEPRKTRLLSLPQGHESGIQCVAYYRSVNPGFALAPKTMARIANLSLELDFDIYCLGSASSDA